MKAKIQTELDAEGERSYEMYFEVEEIADG
jgi:hypothetical protein